MDGSGGARTAWLYQPWNKNSTGIDQGNYGYPLTNPEVYRQEVHLFVQAGVSVGTHAIGDRAIDWVVDTYAAELKEKPASGLRLSIIHANIPTDHAIATMAALEKKYDAGYPEVEPGFTWWIGDTYAGNFGPAGGLTLNAQPVGMAPTQDGGGYWIAAADGGIFSFGAPFYGSLGGTTISSPIRTMSASLDGKGYYLMGNDGALYAFGDAPYLGRVVP